MKNVYNHVVYYVFSLMLLCSPTRLSAQEESGEDEKQAREPQEQEVRPVGEAPAPTAPPPPREGDAQADSYTIPETTVTGEQEETFQATEATTATKTDTPIRTFPNR